MTQHELNAINGKVRSLIFNHATKLDEFVNKRDLGQIAGIELEQGLACLANQVTDFLKTLEKQ